MLYSLCRRVLFSMQPETAHNVTMANLDWATHLGLHKLLTHMPDEDPVEVMGLRFPNTIGLAAGMDKDGTLHWVLPDRRKSYYDEAYLPKKLDRVDETGNLYFDGSNFPWKLADDFAEDKRWGYPKWKVVLGKLTGKGKKGD